MINVGRKTLTVHSARECRFMTLTRSDGLSTRQMSRCTAPGEKAGMQMAMYSAPSGPGVL
jgi:hypothetical protein